MKSTFKHLILLCFIACLLASCNKKPAQIVDYEQVFDVLQLDNQLNDIHMLDDSTYVVGGRTGEAYVIMGDSLLHEYATESGEIYCGLQDGTGHWWIGARNDGLSRWEVPGKGTPRRYIMPDKNTGYSVYSMLPFGKDLLVATSNGLWLTASSTDTLVSVYSRRDGHSDKPESMGFYSPITLSDGTVLYASSAGIYRKDGKKDTISCSWCIEKNVKGISLSSDSARLYALTGCRLWIMEVGSLEDKGHVELPFSAEFMLCAENKLYLMNREYLYVTREEDIVRGEVLFSRIPLKRRIPKNAKSAIVHDRHDGRILILTERAVLSFPSCNGIAEKSPRVKHSCLVDDGKIYFLGEKNDLYAYDPQARGQAQKERELDPAMVITALHVVEGGIFYEESTTSIYRCPLSPIVPVQLWSQSHKVLSYEKDSKSTALLLSGDTAFVGIKDELQLYSLSAGEKNDAPTPADCYATRLHKFGGKLVACTLNNGLLQIVDGRTDTTCREIRFQNDFAVVNDTLSLLLNNHWLYVIRESRAGKRIAEKTDSVPLKGYNRLFLSDSNGIVLSSDTLRRFVVQGDSIILDKVTTPGRFRPEACVQLGDTLFLPTEAGLEIIGIQGTSDAKAAPDFLNFSTDNYDKKEFLLTVARWGSIVLIVVLSVVGIWHHYKKKINRLDEERKAILRIIDILTKKQKELEGENAKLKEDARKLDADCKWLEGEKEDLKNTLNLMGNQAKNIEKILRESNNERIERVYQYLDSSDKRQSQFMEEYGSSMDDALAAIARMNEEQAKEFWDEIRRLEIDILVRFDDRLGQQLKEMENEKFDEWNSRRNDTEEAIKNYEWGKKENQIKDNEQALEKLKCDKKECECLVARLDKAKALGLIDEFNDDNSISPSEKAHKYRTQVTDFKNNNSSTKAIEHHIDKHLNDIKDAEETVSDNNDLKIILSRIKDAYSALKEDMKSLPDVEKLVDDLYSLNLPFSIMISLCNIHKRLPVFRQAAEKKYSNEKEKEEAVKKERDEIEKYIYIICREIYKISSDYEFLNDIGLAFKLTKSENADKKVMGKTFALLFLMAGGNAITNRAACYLFSMDGKEENAMKERSYKRLKQEIKKSIENSKNEIHDYAKKAPMSIVCLLNKVYNDLNNVKYDNSE